MADVHSYERILKSKPLATKLILIAVYLLIVSVWFVLAVRFGIHPAMLLLAPLSLVAAVMLTWKYTSVEYEYSFMSGTFSFAKIYGKSSRKAIFEAEIKSATEVLPYNDATAKRIGKCDMIAIPSKDSQNPCVCVFEDENGDKISVLLDLDEQGAKIFKFFNPSATDRAIFDKLK